MNFLRKFSQSLPVAFGSKFGLQDWYSENNDATKAVQRYAMRFLDSSSMEVKTEAMIQIGHTAFVGGKQATRAAVKWCPLFIDVLTNPKYTHNFGMQLASLQALSEICHDDRKAQEFIMFNRSHHELFRDLISNLESKQKIRIGRWACYVLILCITGNVKMLMEIIHDKELEAALRICADNSDPDWSGWGMNLADLALKLLYFRNPAVPVDGI